jgi:hypothetical protein
MKPCEGISEITNSSRATPKYVDVGSKILNYVNKFPHLLYERLIVVLENRGQRFRESLLNLYQQVVGIKLKEVHNEKGMYSLSKYSILNNNSTFEVHLI